MEPTPQEGTGDADAALLAAYASGDPTAPRALTDRFTPLAWRLARRILGNDADAEDVAQEAMIRLFRVAPVWRTGQARVASWVYRVVANLCADRLRGRAAHWADTAGALPEDIADELPGPDVRLTDAARRRALDRALSALPDRQRLAVVLRHIEGLSNPEIAAIMETGTEAVESLSARGMRALRASLGPERRALGYEDD